MISIMVFFIISIQYHTHLISSYHRCTLWIILIDKYKLVFVPILEITFGEIRNKFLVPSKYGEGVNWPRSTVMACLIRGPEGDLLLEKVYRNSKQRHAEIHFLYDPRVRRYAKTTDISIEVIINYSPCSECAEEIGQFVKKNKVKEINIMFANLYKIPPYPDVVIAKKNENGLYLLSKVPGIQLSVFSTIKDWKRFLGNNFVFTSNAKKPCY